MSNWKNLERKAAKTLNGKRNIDRGMDYHLSRPDVEHPLLSIECKYRAKISCFLKDGIKQAQGYYPDKIPCLILKEKGMRGELAILKLSDFQDLLAWATEIKLRAERKAGEMLKEMDKNIGAKGSKFTGNARVPVKDTTPTLADSGISKNQSANWQKIAEIPEL